MMGAIVLVHRWLGIAFCLLFAMWFATGIVMHFVPFPSLTEAERFAGLASLDRTSVVIAAADAVAASGIADARRVRLIQRSNGPVYIVSGPSRLRAVRASDGTDAAVASPDVALAIARDHARRRGLDAAHAAIVARARYDQWSVPNGFDRHRPLFRVGLGDAAGTEVYVSPRTGEVVLDTTRSERGWNFAGSVLHWIYPTVLRSNWPLWDRLVWTLSLLALIAAVLGAVLGIARIRLPYRGWHALHHIIGLVATTFVLTWIFSGWLSMDHGRLFSRGELTPAEAVAAGAAPDWIAAVSLDHAPLSPSAREVEWFAFNGQLYRRDRIALDKQVLFGADEGGPVRQTGFLSAGEVQRFVARLATGCDTPTVLAANDDYPAYSVVSRAPVYRTICGDVWFDIDAADGTALQRLDASRRAYRWLYSALHTLDFPVLMAHPMLRDGLIVGLCALGFVFSITGIVIGWRRLRLSFAA
ncbi:MULTISPECIES: PepSY domain-containing protein [unclassified Bradyrhizobium]|uniref:PepSY domain-containing protein n=1 Tax=unclassified Bradyrhizobium TaxID=2631580 RepID=UPI002478429E|nr:MULTISPECIES: PepSY domain-containing protein [unclassified Bradyrhizobium]WGR68803.1 PepSY domain-containing protein [Bradyrhizobium sp. ISRA426]WGR80858.1 PepSY domain-containing protein [Bradyrhizobium sp. ISRA430]WGR84043.1 PepSY domain-containing protein [Bradyrhizobium sp. ISRA432]